MKHTALPEDFFARPTLQVARDLIGCNLWKSSEDGLVSARIVETEAYTRDDPACHAYRGPTDRCRLLFGRPGISYVYFIYGMYHCLNVVTEPEGTAGAVLIRAIEVDGGKGPGKLCKTWSIDKQFNGLDMTDEKSELFVTAGKPLLDTEVATSTRIGLSVATERPWRFYIHGHPMVSAKKHGQVGIPMVFCTYDDAPQPKVRIEPSRKLKGKAKA